MAGLPFNAKGWNAKSDSRVLGCWGNWGFGGIGLLMYEFFFVAVVFTRIGFVNWWALEM